MHKVSAAKHLPVHRIKGLYVQSAPYQLDFTPGTRDVIGRSAGARIAQAIYW